MEDEFQKRTVLCYSNFMKYIISFSLFNVFLLIIENSSIIYSVDIMLDGDHILKELFTPFYFLSPHLYLEILNEKLPNQCFQIFDFNSTIEKYEAIQNDNNNDTNNLRYLKDRKKNFRKKRKISTNETNTTTEENKEEEEKEEDENKDPILSMYKRITEDKYFDIKFKGHPLYRLDNSYCVYNKNLIYIAYSIVILVLIF